MKTLNLIFLSAILAACSTRTATDIQKTLHDKSNADTLSNANFDQHDNSITNNVRPLDSRQKLLYVVPIIQKELKVETDYILSFMAANFKNEQDSDSSAAIIAIQGDDYGAEFYITLDNDKKLISFLQTEGGFCAGPTDINDSLMQLCTRRHSLIDGNRIRTFVIDEKIKFSIDKELSIIDSITNLSVIGPKGQIKTTQVDSVRFFRERPRTK